MMQGERRSGLRRCTLSLEVLLALLLLAAPLLAFGESRDDECVEMQDKYKIQPHSSWGLAVHDVQVSLKLY